MFELIHTVSTHPHQVNTFQNMEEVVKAYENTSHRRLFTSSNNRDKITEIGLDEIKTTFEYQEVVNPELRNLVAGMGNKPLEQFKNFRSLFLNVASAEKDTEERKQLEDKIKKLTMSAEIVTNWSGFRFCQEKKKLSLEFVTEWTHTAARVINILDAFYYVQYLGKEEERPDSWEKFKLTDPFKKTEAFRTTIEEITRPIKDPALASDEEGMAACAMQRPSPSRSVRGTLSATC